MGIFDGPPSPPPPTVDPALAQQQADAKQQRIATLQQSLSSDTFGILKMFGQKTAAGAAGIAPPFSQSSGGFATPFLPSIAQVQAGFAGSGVPLGPLGGALKQMGYS
jgi:hypothetical protein